MSALARWQEANRRHLLLAIDLLHARLEGHDQLPDAADVGALERELEAQQEALEAPAALDRVADVFGLDDFERDLLLLCFAAEVDARFRLDDAAVTIGFAFDAVPGAHWSALDPTEPLLQWGLLIVDPLAPLADAPLRCAADVRALLLGFSPHPPAGDPLAPVPSPPLVTTRRAEEAEALVRAVVTASAAAEQIAAVELHDATAEDRRTLASLCSSALDGQLVQIDLRDLPPAGDALEALLRRVNRYAQLTDSHLLIEVDAEHDDPAVRDRLRRALAVLGGLTFLSLPRATDLRPARPLVRHAARRSTAAERTELLQAALEPVLRRLRMRRTRLVDAELDRLGWEFRFDAHALVALVAEAEAAVTAGGSRSAAALAEALRDASRHTVRARMDPLAQRVAIAGDEELVLPDRERAELDGLAAAIVLDRQVNGDWGMGRGHDTAAVALFSGPSGTGKTHAAAVLARAVGLDLYRVDLSGILSKYIGETERNLRALFDAAELGGLILLFDEADALFGKRSDVKDSHDRYANITTSYLLQRIERSPVPTILTTNLREALDPAFLRRLHVVIDFPFPDEQARAAIWRTAFPPETPTEGLELQRLAQLVLTGGVIERVARRGAFQAAADGEPVRMAHLLDSARDVAFTMLERDLSPAELAGWTT